MCCGWKDGRKDNVKSVYPPNTVCGGIIMTFIILKSDNIENSRIESKGIVLQVPSNQLKLHLLLFFLVHLCFFPVSHRN